MAMVTMQTKVVAPANVIGRFSAIGDRHLTDNGDGTSSVDWSSNLTPGYRAGIENLRKLFPTSS